VVASEPPRAGDGSQSHGDTWWTQSREIEAGATGTHGGPRAALSREAGAEATGTCGDPGATPSREAGAGALGHTGMRAHMALCLDLELVCGGT
jgi:hypothetical protein